MTSLATTVAGLDLPRIQQTLKWIVYATLIINFGFYVYEDLDRAIHTLHEGSTLFDLTGEFATTGAYAAWLVLLFMLELETYVLEERHWKPWVARTVHGTRIICYLLIAHTVVAFADAVIEYAPTIPVETESGLCDLAGQGQSFVFNLEYTEITADSCAALSDETTFFRLGKKNPLVSSYEGLELERDLALSDLIEIITWLIIIFAIEVVVRLQGRGITGGPVRSTAQVTKVLGYSVLFILAVYWASLGHWLYTWDTFVWVAGFAAIEMNVSDWRDELLAGEEPPLALEAGAS